MMPGCLQFVVFLRPQFASPLTVFPASRAEECVSRPKTKHSSTTAVFGMLLIVKLLLLLWGRVWFMVCPGPTPRGGARMRPI